MQSNKYIHTYTIYYINQGLTNIYTSALLDQEITYTLKYNLHADNTKVILVVVAVVSSSSYCVRQNCTPPFCNLRGASQILHSLLK